MPLDDERIERYSRQLILQEIGPRGQEALAGARVAVIGTGVAAERVVAYLGAAGVGRIAADPMLHALVDPAQPDCRMVALDAVANAHVTVAIVTGTSPDAVTADVEGWRPRAGATLWIAAGCAGGVPALPRATACVVPPELVTLRDALLGTVVATEAVKAILGIGEPLAGKTLAYDPTTATVAIVAAG
jgi:hypothetical protein